MACVSGTSARLVGIGLVAGVFSSLFGVGGGLVIVPLLLLLAAYPPHEATATSLGAVAITALAGVVAYALRHDIRYSYAALVGLPATIGVIGGAALQQRFSGRALTLSFALLLVGIGIWLMVG
ncbi:MAG: sulfite exporter TauE/SafE family protein [Actinobacteria bacterium]|nr:MAG: sulfite exporter TauE/SafE family protein [Actinomycetota bacterium]